MDTRCREIYSARKVTPYSDAGLPNIRISWRGNLWKQTHKVDYNHILSHERKDLFYYINKSIFMFNSLFHAKNYIVIFTINI